ncbi:hypothetical protein B296_00046740 [Ensete ventricosum]|uniref:Uncharacterized protein n=1 Tax=Ensete ventricosum TaxID=4639 RepID=A0A426XHI9_ENSVE|nr:hypothetical protein B296_00046740 [Ensete ventricosum]
MTGPRYSSGSWVAEGHSSGSWVAKYPHDGSLQRNSSNLILQLLLKGREENKRWLLKLAPVTHTEESARLGSSRVPKLVNVRREWGVRLSSDLCKAGRLPAWVVGAPPTAVCQVKLVSTISTTVAAWSPATALAVGIA